MTDIVFLKDEICNTDEVEYDTVKKCSKNLWAGNGTDKSLKWSQFSGRTIIQIFI